MKFSHAIVMLALLSSSLFGAGMKFSAVEAASTFDSNADAWDGQDDFSSEFMRADDDLTGSFPPSSQQDAFDDTQTGSFPPPSVSNEVPTPLSASVPAASPAQSDSAIKEEKCVPGGACFSDQECGKDNPNSFCAGSSLLGTCRCSACPAGSPCKSDVDCGGLKFACQPLEGVPATGDSDEPKFCNCRGAFKSNGFPTYVAALKTFCNVRECDGKSDVCFGLPCRSGICVCP